MNIGTHYSIEPDNPNFRWTAWFKDKTSGQQGYGASERSATDDLLRRVSDGRSHPEEAPFI